MAVSDDERYILDVPNEESRKLAIGWLVLALGSLVFGGLLTVLIVLSRTPGVQDFIPWIDFFHTAIVVHVDLTVLVWFLSFAGLMWSLTCSPKAAKWNWLALGITTLGTIIFAVSPFFGAANPLMNNYVPVLQDPMFLVGLAIFGVGFSVLVVTNLIYQDPIGKLDQAASAIRFAIMTAIVAALVSVLSVVATYLLMPASYEGRQFYELLFWGGGHVLQFTHTQLMLVAWLWLATTTGVMCGINPRTAAVIFGLGFLPVLFTPIIYVVYDVASAEHLTAFTKMMQYGGGIAPVIIGCYLLMAVVGEKRKHIVSRPESIALLFSVILFGAGGIIGYLIREINVTVPAHYHGSIVAVTLAFMGLTYYLLPRLGFAEPMFRLARWQPAIYGGGQLMHVLGLAWSGGYGVKRKTAGAAQGLDNVPEIIGMAVMGLGGLIAVIGGLLFLIIAFKSILGGRVKQQPGKLVGSYSAQH